MIIGISGYAQSGKDSTANVLVEKHGFERHAFADTMRDCLLAVNPIVDVEHDECGCCMGGFKRLKDIIDEIGWDRAKVEYPEVRQLMQRLGTEMGRNILGVNIWVDTFFNRFGHIENLVIPDTRFENEYDGIYNRGGIVIRINRPGVGPANDHISETGLDEFDFSYWINNDGTLDDLADLLDMIVKEEA